MAINSANEAYIPHIIFHLSLLISESGKCIDNNTEDDIEKQRYDNHEEGQIVECSQVIDLLRLIEVRVGWQCVTDTTTSTQTEVQCIYEAKEETAALYVSFFCFVELDIVVEVVIKEESEQKHGVDVNED